METMRLMRKSKTIETSAGPFSVLGNGRVPYQLQKIPRPLPINGEQHQYLLQLESLQALGSSKLLLRLVK
jgi:hypothetical protein